MPNPPPPTSTTNPPQNLDIHATLYFCSRDPKFKTEKPYTVRYDPGGLFPATNIVSEKHCVAIRNMRIHRPQYDTSGFTFSEFGTSMKYEDFEDEELIRGIHIPEMEQCLRKTLKAGSVNVIDFAIRRRHRSYPVATGDAFTHMQPTSRAHLDVTENSAQEDMRRALGEETAEKIMQGRWQYVNVWHPLWGPLQDWPLAICDASSVDFSSDTMAGDVVDRDDVNENMQVQYNKNQKWYYLPLQLSTELLIFKNADGRSKREGVPFGTPHAAFDNPLRTGEGPLRESIEMRAIVAW